MLNAAPTTLPRALARHRIARWTVLVALLTGMGLVELLLLRPAWVFLARLLGLPAATFQQLGQVVSCGLVLPLTMAKASIASFHIEPSA